jgi:hypothetical protein
MPEIVALKYLGMFLAGSLTTGCLMRMWYAHRDLRRESASLRKDLDELTTKLAETSNKRLSYRTAEQIETAILHLVASQVRRAEEDAAVTILQQTLQSGKQGEQR